MMHGGVRFLFILHGCHICGQEKIEGSQGSEQSANKGPPLTYQQHQIGQQFETEASKVDYLPMLAIGSV